ncbi:protein spitz-like isoform X3 [Aphis craccivora]|uniref:Protein spitz-like isoform X3 n=1 Tax=Aphis craccivora TaxID=307492 RepID=A0A6G0ZIS5_APHCR|nr:protein spitz-like isoform X3 [Aphis craccivora]
MNITARAPSRRDDDENSPTRRERLDRPNCIGLMNGPWGHRCAHTYTSTCGEAKKKRDRIPNPRSVRHTNDLPTIAARRQVMLESASIASGVSVAVLLVFIICTTFYVRSKRQRKLKLNAADVSMVDGNWTDAEKRPFSYRPKHTIITIPLKTVITEQSTRSSGDGRHPDESSRQEPLIV